MYEQFYQWLSTQFVDNEMFIGVITASSIGTALYMARAFPATLPHEVISLSRRRILGQPIGVKRAKTIEFERVDRQVGSHIF